MSKLISAETRGSIEEAAKHEDTRDDRPDQEQQPGGGGRIRPIR